MGGKKKALIISISDYNDDSLPKLEFCKHDGEEMYQTLSNLGYEIKETHKIIGKADQKTIRHTLIKFFRNDVNIDDTLLFYFSGHGVLDGYGGRFFANTDVSSEIPELDGVRFEVLNEQMEKSNAEKKIAILDCCFSGGAVPTLTGKAGDDQEKEAENLGREGLDKVFGKSQGSCVLASSLSSKRSFALADKSHSAFTRFVIEGLKGKKDSVDENGFVTPEKLSTYVFKELQKVPDLANQKPVRNLSIAGKIILAEHPQLSKQAEKKQTKSRVSDLLDQNISASELKEKLAVMFEIEHKVFEEINISPDVIEEKKESPTISKDALNKIQEIKGAKEEIHEKLESLGEKPEVDVSLTLKEANLGYFVGNYDEANKLYDKVLEVEPTNHVAKKNKELTVNKLDLALGKNKVWKNKDIDILALSQRIEKFFKSEGFNKVRIEEDPDGNWYDVQAKKGGIKSTLSGTRKAIHVLIEKNSGELKVSMTLGEWGKNLAIAAGTAFLTWGVTAAAGAIANAKFRKKLWDYIEESVSLLSDENKSQGT